MYFSISDMDLVNLKEDFLKAEALISVIDPKETPFESKYQARKILRDLVTKVENNKAILGGVHCLLGIIDVDVEEFSQGETDLLQALNYICDEENRDKIIIHEIKTLNQLGILWCLRDNFEKAKTYLDRSLESYENFLQREDKKCLYELSDLFDESKFPSFEEKENVLELLNTHTHYYLAQVYEKMGDASKAAECCHITLTKQLELKEFQHLDWATNAAMLSQHYLAKEDYSTTKRHLIASWVMLDRYENELSSKESSQELEDDRHAMLQKCRAEVSRAWGKYSLLLLQRSMDYDIEQFELQDQLVDVKDEVKAKSIDFPSIETDPELDDIPEKFAKNFEEARAIFLPGQRFLNKAKNEYFKFEEHCVDYVEIQRDLSHMHKLLVYFEKDESRKFKIQKRRIDLLETPAKELNPQLFTLLVRQLWYEIAETYSTMMDIKLDMVKNGEASMTPQLTNKINGLVSASINSFHKYLDTLGKNPTKYPEDNERPALVAYVHLARLYDKYILPENSEQKFRNKMQSYLSYKHVVDYCKANPGSQSSVDQELPICEEMVLLLPRKLQKMQQELNS